MPTPIPIEQAEAPQIRTSTSSQRAWAQEFLWVASAGLLAVLVASGFMAIQWIRYGSIENAFASVHGKAIALTQASSVIDVDRSGHRRCTIEVRAENLTDKPIKLVGATATCSCVSLANLPLSIMPRDSEAFRVLLSSNDDGKFDEVQTIDVYSDNASAFATQISLHPNQ